MHVGSDALNAYDVLSKEFIIVRSDGRTAGVLHNDKKQTVTRD